MFTRTALAAFVSAAALCQAGLIGLAPAPADPQCARNYTVRLGDTCDLISAHLNVSTYQLATVNADKIDAACDNLALGEPLCLGIVGEDCDVVHVIESGDLCTEIAANAGTSLSTLLANNPNVNSLCSNIYPGEVLCTATEVIVKPAVSGSA